MANWWLFLLMYISLNIIGYAEYMEGDVNIFNDAGFSFLGRWMFGYNTGNGTINSWYLDMFKAGVLDITLNLHKPLETPTFFELALYDDHSSSWPLFYSNKSNGCITHDGIHHINTTMVREYQIIFISDVNDGNDTWTGTINIHEHIIPRWWWVYLIKCDFDNAQIGDIVTKDIHYKLHWTHAYTTDWNREISLNEQSQNTFHCITFALSLALFLIQCVMYYLYWKKKRIMVHFIDNDIDEKLDDLKETAQDSKSNNLSNNINDRTTMTQTDGGEILVEQEVDIKDNAEGNEGNIFCINCSAENVYRAIYCFQCGSKLYKNKKNKTVNDNADNLLKSFSKSGQFETFRSKLRMALVHKSKFNDKTRNIIMLLITLMLMVQSISDLFMMNYWLNLTNNGYKQITVLLFGLIFEMMVSFIFCLFLLSIFCVKTHKTNLLIKITIIAICTIIAINDLIFSMISYGIIGNVNKEIVLFRYGETNQIIFGVISLIIAIGCLITIILPFNKQWFKIMIGFILTFLWFIWPFINIFIVDSFSKDRTDFICDILAWFMRALAEIILILTIYTANW